METNFAMTAILRGHVENAKGNTVFGVVITAKVAKSVFAEIVVEPGMCARTENAMIGCVLSVHLIRSEHAKSVKEHSVGLLVVVQLVNTASRRFAGNVLPFENVRAHANVQNAMRREW